MRYKDKVAGGRAGLLNRCTAKTSLVATRSIQAHRTSTLLTLRLAAGLPAASAAVTELPACAACLQVGGCVHVAMCRPRRGLRLCLRRAHLTDLPTHSYTHA